MIAKRSDKIAFLGITTTSGQTTATTYYRMKNFSEITVSKNPIEYSRQYVDEDSERNDVIGYSPSISYAFDYEPANDVHKKIVGITDGELTGSAAIVDIVIVDLNDETATTGTFGAVKRSFAVVPDSEGSGTDAYAYSGTFKANGSRISGTSTTTDAWQTMTFAADE